MTEIHELRKQIVVKYFDLTKNGLIEEYAFNGVKKEINLNKQGTCALLKQAGLINSWEAYNGKVYVSYNTEYNAPTYCGEHYQDCSTATEYFTDFVSNTDFSKSDAIQCAAYYEKQERFRAAVNREAKKVLGNDLKCLEIAK